MGYAITQAGSDLQLVQPDGTITTLTLPDGVTLDTTRRGRFASLNQQVFLVNSPTVNLWFDPVDQVLRSMNIRPPVGAPTTAVGSGTGLTGDYKVKQSFAHIRSADGVVMNESPLSPASLSLTLADESLALSNLAQSTDDTVNTIRIYRTTAGGEVYFHWMDLKHGVTTAEGNLPDAGLSLLPAEPTLGNPPGTLPGTRLTLITEWNNRLWAVSAAYDERDDVVYTEDGFFYQWGNSLPIPPLGEDATGVTGFIRRRDELGIAKQNLIAKIVGDSNADFEVIIVAEGVGCVAPDSIVVIRDIGYFLWDDGVYTFGPDGVTKISDKVDSWFKTDTYFNREHFADAVGGYNPATDTYDLHLHGVGSDNLDRWVSFDIRRQEWLGPHLTGAGTPTLRALLADSDDIRLPVIADSSGFLWAMNQSGASDGGNAIAVDWLTKFFAAGTPDIYKHWGQGSLFQKIQAAGSWTLTPKVGGLGASFGTAQTPTLTSDRVRLARFGDGRYLQLRFQHSTDEQDVELYGLELPYVEVGRR